MKQTTQIFGRWESNFKVSIATPKSCATPLDWCVQIRSIFWSVFSCARTEYGDLRSKSPIQSEYRKIRTRKYSIFGHFSRSDELKKRWNFPALAFRPLFIKHCGMSDKMLFNPGIICSNLIPVIKGVVSSAWLEKLTFLFTIKRPQKYIINKRRTRIDPSGIP